MQVAQIANPVSSAVPASVTYACSCCGLFGPDSGGCGAGCCCTPLDTCSFFTPSCTGPGAVTGEHLQQHGGLPAQQMFLCMAERQQPAIHMVHAICYPVLLKACATDSHAGAQAGFMCTAAPAVSTGAPAQTLVATTAAPGSLQLSAAPPVPSPVAPMTSPAPVTSTAALPQTAAPASPAGSGSASPASGSPPASAAPLPPAPASTPGGSPAPANHVQGVEEAQAALPNLAQTEPPAAAVCNNLPPPSSQYTCAQQVRRDYVSKC